MARILQYQVTFESHRSQEICIQTLNYVKPREVQKLFKCCNTLMLRKTITVYAYCTFKTLIVSKYDR